MNIVWRRRPFREVFSCPGKQEHRLTPMVEWTEGPLESPCLLFLGATSPNGYGKLQHGGRLVPAHRLSWEMTNGPIPDGLWVLHRCDVRRCVNPAHLFLGDNADNVRDMVAKGRDRWADHRASWSCEHDQATSRRKGRPGCRLCANARTRELYRQKRGAA